MSVDPPPDVGTRWRILRLHDWLNTGGLLLGLVCLAQRLNVSLPFLHWHP